MDKLPFLSTQWLAAVSKMRDVPDSDASQAAFPGSPGEAVRVNQVITGAPFGNGTVLAHIHTSGGKATLGLGHLENPDVTLTLDYPVARAILLDGNPQAAMKAFMTGQLRVEGEMTKLITAQRHMPHIFGPELAARIRQMTA